MTTLAAIAHSAAIEANRRLAFDRNSLPDHDGTAIDNALTLASMVSSPARIVWESACDGAGAADPVQLTTTEARAVLADRALVAALDALRAELNRIHRLSGEEAAAALSTAEYPVTVIQRG